MFALKFNFPTGRFHATPWGRHVNEAAVAWPPEPYRIARALIATYWRKTDRDTFPPDRLARLIERLAEAPPRFQLPNAVHAHTRHFMPAPVKKTLVFDAFARFDPDDPIVALWPELTLSDEEFTLAKHLAKSLGYLGRAEAWVEAEAVTEYDVSKANCYPASVAQKEVAGGRDKCVNQHILTPLSAGNWAAQRSQYLDANTDRQNTKARRNFEASIPETLVDALAVDTSNIQAAGWSAPPAGRQVLYIAPELGPLPRRPRVFPQRGEKNMPTIACYVLAGRPRPRVEDTIKIAEIMRLAAMSKFGFDKVDGKRQWRAPPVISGKGLDGKALANGSHAHAFFLPEDQDGDGEIDHVIVYAPTGFDARTRAGLDQVTQIYQKRHRGGDEQSAPGRKEWRLALEGFGSLDCFPESRVLGKSQTWTSATPYLMPWHTKKHFGAKEMITKECRLRGLRVPESIETINDKSINGRKLGALHF